MFVMIADPAKLVKRALSLQAIGRLERAYLAAAVRELS
jgi:hypothetical protein